MRGRIASFASAQDTTIAELRQLVCTRKAIAFIAHCFRDRRERVFARRQRLRDAREASTSVVERVQYYFMGADFSVERVQYYFIGANFLADRLRDARERDLNRRQRLRDRLACSRHHKLVNRDKR